MLAFAQLRGVDHDAAILQTVIIAIGRQDLIKQRLLLNGRLFIDGGFGHLVDGGGQSGRARGKQRQSDAMFTNRFQHGLSFAVSVHARARVVVNQRDRNIGQQYGKGHAIRIAAEATD